MSIQSEIDRLKAAKSGLAEAIASKGVEVPQDTALSSFPSLVAQIQQGGGLEPLIGTTETVTPAQVVEALQQGRQVVITAIIQQFYGADAIFSSWIVFNNAAMSSIFVPEQYSSFTLTLVGNSSSGWETRMGSGQMLLPDVSSSDVGKFLRVHSSGLWAAEDLPVYNGEVESVE